MALMDGLKNLFSSKNNNNMQYAKLLNGYAPIFSQFGNDVYASDVVQTCIDIIATECSKLMPKHIRTDNNDMQINVKSSINRLFKFAPNELMTTKDFIEKTIWLLYMNYNAFVYPTYDIGVDSKGNNQKYYTGFYPINPTQVTFLQDELGTLFVKLQFSSGYDYTLPYSDVIHLRKKYSVNEIMGGGLNGQPDNAAILKVLSINDTVLQGLGNAIKTSLSIRGIIKINTILDDAKQQEERKRFETSMKNSESGILPMDLKNEYQDIKVDPKIIDKDTMQFMQDKLLNYYGISVPILSGDFNDEQYQAFYEKTLEPIIISLGQAFSKTIFSPRELDFGNEIVFYQKDMMYLSTAAKLNLLKTAGEQGLLTDNQKLAILGYPPIEGGDKRTISLNYIDVNLASEYQLKKSGTSEIGVNINAQQQKDIVDVAEETTGSKLNGAQVQSLISVVESYKNGVIGKTAALTIITSSFGIGQTQAEQILEDPI
jgi:HK97 family phage portal protein